MAVSMKSKRLLNERTGISSAPCCCSDTCDLLLSSVSRGVKATAAAAAHVIPRHCCARVCVYRGTGGLMRTLMLLSQRASEVAFHSIKSVCGCLATEGPVFQSGAVCSRPTIRQARGKTGGGEDERRKYTNWRNGRGGLEGFGSMAEQTACLSVCVCLSASTTIFLPELSRPPSSP